VEEGEEECPLHPFLAILPIHHHRQVVMDPTLGNALVEHHSRDAGEGERGACNHTPILIQHTAHQARGLGDLQTLPYDSPREEKIHKEGKTKPGEKGEMRKQGKYCVHLL
jgi:hypothetical protein